MEQHYTGFLNKEMEYLGSMRIVYCGPHTGTGYLLHHTDHHRPTQINSSSTKVNSSSIHINPQQSMQSLTCSHYTTARQQDLNDAPHIMALDSASPTQINTSYQSKITLRPISRVSHCQWHQAQHQGPDSSSSHSSCQSISLPINTNYARLESCHCLEHTFT